MTIKDQLKAPKKSFRSTVSTPTQSKATMPTTSSETEEFEVVLSPGGSIAACIDDDSHMCLEICGLGLTDVIKGLWHIHYEIIHVLNEDFDSLRTACRTVAGLKDLDLAVEDLNRQLQSIKLNYYTVCRTCYSDDDLYAQTLKVYWQGLDTYSAWSYDMAYENLASDLVYRLNQRLRHFLRGIPVIIQLAETILQFENKPQIVTPQ